MKKEIPQEILVFAKDELEWLKAYKYPHVGEMFFLGERDGVKYYEPYYPDAELGFPTIYLINRNGKCDKIEGEDALDIICSFPEK